MTRPIELRFRHAAGREVIETDLIITSHAAWMVDPRSSDPSWSVAAIDDDDGTPPVAAVQICLAAGCSARLLDAYHRFDQACGANGV
jgi:hypothetical protein